MSYSVLSLDDELPGVSDELPSVENELPSVDDNDNEDDCVIIV